MYIQRESRKGVVRSSISSRQGSVQQPSRPRGVLEIGKCVGVEHPFDALHSTTAAVVASREKEREREGVGRRRRLGEGEVRKCRSNEEVK